MGGPNYCHNPRAAFQFETEPEEADFSTRFHGVTGSLHSQIGNLGSRDARRLIDRVLHQRARDFEVDSDFEHKCLYCVASL